jgi:hypothetical protein
MATVPVPRTWTTGEIITAAEMNTEIRDSVNFLLATPRCIIYRSTDRICGSSSTPSAILFDTEITDTDSMHSGSNTYMVANTAGRYEFILYIHFPSFSSAPGTAQCGIALNSSGTWSATSRLNEDTRIMCQDTTLGTSLSIRAVQYMNVNDQAEFFAAQTCGSTLTIAGNIPFNLTASGRWLASS